MGAESNRSAYEALGLAWSLGWRVAAGAWIGYQLDQWSHTGGLFTLTLALAAMVIGVRGLVRAGHARDGEEGS